MDYKDKIRKLFALATNTGKAEAELALLRARELMAKYKIEETDLQGTEKQGVKDLLTDITCSKRRDPWIIRLSTIIGDNCFCTSYRWRTIGKQTYYIGFIGLTDDVEICVEIFQYAVHCIRTEIRAIKKEDGEFGTAYVKKQCDSYGYGFVDGIQTTFEQQNKANREKWGLALVMPQEVQKATQKFQRKQFQSRAAKNIDPDAYLHGYKDGKEFDPAHRCKDEE